MHSKLLLAVALPALRLASSAPEPALTSPRILVKRDFPKFEDWDADQEHKKKKIEAALPEAIDLVARVVQASEGYRTTYKPIFDKYFPPEDHKKVIKVFKRIVPDYAEPGTGHPRLHNCQIIGYNVQKFHCDEGADAYTLLIPDGFDLEKPGPLSTVTHFCDTAYRQTMSYSDTSCQDIGSKVSKEMNFFAATIMHEWLHNDDIGKAVIGQHIEDVDGDDGYGPVNVRNMRNCQPEQCKVNADSYTWLALELFWTINCRSNNRKIPYYNDPPGVDRD